MAIPLAILLAGFIIAIGVYVVRTDRPVAAKPIVVSNVRPISAIDHIQGDPTAPIVVITYSDIECEYCKQFQKTMEQIIAEYGPDRKVAWVYRHFPLMEVHENALTHARAAECVYALKGDAGFFSFINLLQSYSARAGNFTPDNYDLILPQVGVTRSELDACLKKASGEDRIKADIDNGVNVGVDATPFMIILLKGKEPQSISGALPYESMKRLIDESLTRLSEEAQ